jgi:hypothetical protein
VGLSLRDLPSNAYYEAAISSFDRTKVRFLVFSDDLTRARYILFMLQRYGYKVHFIDENVVMSLLLMSMCRHHIMTSSTLSFWGAYLDSRQPLGGRTIFPKSFLKEHGKTVIPYSEWEMLDF